MKEKCITCGSCGMPLLKKEDHAKGDLNIEICCYCVKEDGSLKNYEEVLQGTAEYFIHTQGITQDAAYKMAKQLLDGLPYWKKNSNL